MALCAEESDPRQRGSRTGRTGNGCCSPGSCCGGSWIPFEVLSDGAVAFATGMLERRIALRRKG